MGDAYNWGDSELSGTTSIPRSAPTVGLFLLIPLAHRPIEIFSESVSGDYDRHHVWKP